MAFEIKWTDRAKLSFRSISNFLLETWNEEICEAFANGVFTILDVLKAFPRMGNALKRDSEIRSIQVAKHIRLYYTVQENAVVLLTFFDTRQDPEKLNVE